MLLRRSSWRAQRKTPLALNPTISTERSWFMNTFRVPDKLAASGTYNPGETFGPSDQRSNQSSLWLLKLRIALSFVCKSGPDIAVSGA